jgi:pyruvate kinase
MHSASNVRRVKIVCTLGPSSSSPEVIGQLIEAGMNVARLNFSHGTHEFHKGLIQTIRSEAAKRSQSVAILQDLQGPKIRAGKIPSPGIMLKNGERYILHPEGSTPILQEPGAQALPISAEIADPVSRDARVGAQVLFDDGKIATRILKISPPEILVQVEVGGKLTSNKGMNLPGSPLSIPCVTEKDLEDLEFGLSQGVDAVALSFVRQASDLENVRSRMRKRVAELPLLIAKVERDEAVENMDSIIAASDGILVARGDMAVELGAERVPAIQKRLIHSCNILGVPIITATQMLESMIQTPTPTRAEASDVANAVFDGTDAVMLSGETASGEYPVIAVQTMSRIVLEAERSREFYSGPQNILPLPGSVVESIEFSTSRIAQHVGAVAIGCITHSGMAAKVLSKFRPETPIIAITENDAVLRKLCFYWGVRGVTIPKIVATDDVFQVVESVLMEHGLAEAEDLIVVTAGVPTLRRGTTNMVKVHRVAAKPEYRSGPSS